MYLPKAFAVEDTVRPQDFMEQYNFAILVTQRDGELMASHIPLVLDRSPAPYGILRGHLAIGDPQVKDLEAGAQAIVVFQGPHAYVSPSWYVEPQNVPTWNYAVVHAYGVSKILERVALIALLKDLTAKHERGFGRPWDFDPGESWIQKLLPAIAGFEIRIDKLQGKFKLNQNRAANDRAGVIEKLSASDDATERAVASLLK